MGFPRTPISEAEAIEQIREITEADASVKNDHGGILAMAFEPSDLAMRLYSEFLETNYFYGRMYPGIARLEREAVSMIADLCGCAKATGDIVSGGTTANILALKAARDGAVKKNPNVVMPATAHPSLLKVANSWQWRQGGSRAMKRRIVLSPKKWPAL